jgi:single-strand DNA-binding protein
MNKVFLIGNITKDPEIKTTSTGKKVASLSLAVSDGKDANGQNVSQFFNLKAWEKTAEIIEKYCQKGHKIGIVGKITTRKWEKEDGTVAYITEILVNEIELLTSKSEAEKKSKVSDQDELPEINIDDL